MKQLLMIIISFYTTCSFAQNPVVNLTDRNGERVANTYYKDVNNLLNQFEGTYLYSNGIRQFKVVLVKKVMQYNGSYYEDLIIGEYQFKVNGIEIINTLQEIGTVYNNQIKHSISGKLLINNHDREWPCPLCEPNEKRLIGSIKDVTSNRFAEIFMRRTIENGQQIMKIKIGPVTGVSYYNGDPAPAQFSLPKGEMTFIKQ